MPLKRNTNILIRETRRRFRSSLAESKTATRGEPSLFQTQLEKTPFTMFEPRKDLGYFAWAPTGRYKNLSELTSVAEITKYLSMNGRPSRMRDPQQVELPQPFLHLHPTVAENIFPYGENAIAGLLVAAARMPTVLDDTVEFCFGGSVLKLLASQNVDDDQGPCHATKVPGTQVILVVKAREYLRNLADQGFQFERLLTGKGHMRDTMASSTFTEHLHIMQVGDHSVLFQTGVDAVYRDEPIELTASNPFFWGTRRLFQLVSSGSPHLCHGIKRRGVLEDLQLRTLSSCAKEAEIDYPLAERRIRQGMEALKVQMAAASEGEVFRISLRDGSLHLQAEPPGGMVLLPPPNVVRDALGLSK